MEIEFNNAHKLSVFNGMFASTFFFARLLTGIYDRQVYISQSCICSTHFHTCRIPWLLPRPNFKLMNFYSSQTWMNGPCSQETSIFLGESWWHQLVNPLNTEPHQGTHRLQPAAMIRPKERDVEKSLAECWLWVGESFLGSSSPTFPMFLYSDAF